MNSTAAATGYEDSKWRSRGRRLLARARDYITYIVFGLVTLYFVIIVPNFATLTTADVILRVTSIVAIMAVGMTFVIVSAEIDLSVGSMASLAGVISAMAMTSGLSWPVAVLLTLAVGAAVGLFNGIMVTRFKVPSFLVTLGMLIVLAGAAMTLTGTRSIPIVNPGFQSIFWSGSLLGIPAPIWWILIVTVIGLYLLHFTPFGKRVFATGGNSVAARYSGVHTDRVKIAALMLSGITASLSGLLMTARSTAGNPTFGEGLELDVIAAVIIGGTSLFGGRGAVIGSVVGAIFIGIIGFGLLVMGYSTSVQQIIKGAIIIGAVAVARK